MNKLINWWANYCWHKWRQEEGPNGPRMVCQKCRIVKKPYTTK